MVKPELFQEPTASALERLRDKRMGSKLTFDCFHAHLNKKGGVFCTQGKTICKNKSGNMPILTCLKGGITPVCSQCELFETE